VCVLAHMHSEHAGNVCVRVWCVAGGGKQLEDTTSEYSVDESWGKRGVVHGTTGMRWWLVDVTVKRTCAAVEPPPCIHTSLAGPRW